MRNPNVTPIEVPYPASGELHLRFAVGACRLRIAPAEGATWLAGSYEDPTGNLPMRIDQRGGAVRVTQRPSWTDVFGWLVGVPRFDLALGKDRPFMLTLESGASEVYLDLGGVPISRLVVKHGAGKMDTDFSSPNPEVMTLLNLGAGAGDTTLRNLANANCGEMIIEGGAATYRFDFGGTLQRSAHVRISTGVSSVDISVPATTAAKVTPESVLGGVDVVGAFTRQEGAFYTQGALDGRSPMLTIQTSVALGSLRLRAT